jgi:hypothetical protein
MANTKQLGELLNSSNKGLDCCLGRINVALQSSITWGPVTHNGVCNY